MKIYRLANHLNNEVLTDIICAWCKTKIGEKMIAKHPSDKEKTITHGICQECFDKEISKN